MDDTISRQMAIDELKACRDVFCDGTTYTFSALPYGEKCRVDEIDNAIAILVNLPSAQPEQQHRRILHEIIVEYPPISTYPEYEGKPYFSIKYTEDGQEFIGYGTYKPVVLSEYLKEYFLPSAQPLTAYVISDEDGNIKCSNCGSSECWGNYCMNCGAKMRGENNG